MSRGLAGTMRPLTCTPRRQHLPSYYLPNRASLSTSRRAFKGKRQSSQQWLQRQSKDTWVKHAAQDGYRSRAAYKLLQLNSKYQFLEPDSYVLDLGCAPGSWLQVCSQECKSGVVIGVDLLDVEPIPNVMTFQGDIRDDKVLAKVQHSLPHHTGQPSDARRRNFSVLLSDMASSATGQASIDALRTQDLIRIVLEIWCPTFLQIGGSFVCKALDGPGHPDLVRDMKTSFRSVVQMRPRATRKESKEVYLIARHHLGNG